MANILPKNSLRATRRLYLARAVFLGSLVAIVCSAVALLALIPAYATVLASATVGGAPEVAIRATDDDRAAVMRAQSLVRQLKPLATTSIPIAELIGEVLDARVGSIRVERIGISRGEDVSTISVGGSMRSRDDINAYRAALAENPRFEHVSVPLGVLTGSAEAGFTVTITGSI